MKYLIHLIIIVNIVLTGFQFFLSVNRSEDSKKLWDLQTQIRVIKSENTDLSNQIAQKAALVNLFDKASAASLSALAVTAPTPVAVALATQ